MSDRDTRRYDAAIAASGVSVLGWLGTVAGAVYTVSALLFEMSAETPPS